ECPLCAKSGHWPPKYKALRPTSRHRTTDAVEHHVVGTKVMTKNRLNRRVLLTPGQKAEAAQLRTMGFTRSQAWCRVLTSEQRQVFYDQIRTAERLRYIKNPYREHETLETALADAAPNTMLGSLRLPRMTWIGRRTARSCRGSNSIIRAVTETIQQAHL